MMPDISDGVAKKNNAILAGRGRFEGGIGIAVAGELAEIIGVDGDAGGAVLIETGKAGGGDRRRGLARLLSECG